jgi:hypothetical protein
MVNGVKMKLIKTVTDNYILADTTKEFHGEGYLLGATTVSDAPKLSKQNCDEIFGVVDVEKLAREWHKQQNFNSLSDNIISVGYLNMFKDGFNKAMELNKDKVFSKGDMAYIMNIMSIHDISFEDAIIKFQLLQQPTEIEVEIEMECKIGCDNFIFNGDKSICCGNKIKKLDSNGNLILRKL